MTPRISVIIPVYNGERFLAQAIQSVLDQEYPAHEIIVIDDGSTDNTPKVLESFKGKIITERTPNQGVSNARNTGLKIAAGDYIAFLDADDVWFKNKLKKQAEAIQKYPEAGFICSNFASRYGEFGMRLRPHFSILRNKDKMEFNSPLKKSPFALLVEENFIGTASSVVVSRRLVNETGAFNTAYRYSEEYDYFLRCAKASSFVILSDMLFYKRTHSQNLSQDKTLYYLSHQKVLEDNFNADRLFFKNAGVVDQYFQEIANTQYALGTLCFEKAEYGKALGHYLAGLRAAKTPRNLSSFLWVISKKLIRLLTFDLCSRRNVARLLGRPS